MQYNVSVKYISLSSLWHCLTTELKPKGRSELRDHAKVTRAIKAQCTEGDDQKFKKTAVLELDEDRFKYVQRSVKGVVDKEVPGALAEGYDDLLDALEAAEKANSAEKTK